MVSWKTYDSVNRANFKDPKYITIHRALALDDDEVEEIAQLIEKLHHEHTFHKGHVGQGPLKRAARLRAMVKIRAYADRVDIDYDDHYAHMNGKFIYVLATGNWRVDGRKVWYNSKSPEHFIENYVLKSPFDN